jgi:cell shape-determining protein MreC
VLQFKEKEKLEQQVEELKKENVRLSNLIRFSRE